MVDSATGRLLVNGLNPMDGNAILPTLEQMFVENAGRVLTTEVIFQVAT